MMLSKMINIHDASKDPTNEEIQILLKSLNRAVGTAAALFGLSVFLFTENPLKCFIL